MPSLQSRWGLDSYQLAPGVFLLRNVNHQDLTDQIEL